MSPTRSYQLMVRNMMAWMHYTTFSQAGGEVSYCDPLTVFDAHQSGTAANFLVWEDPYSPKKPFFSKDSFFHPKQSYLGWSYGLPGSAPAPAPGNWEKPVHYPGMLLENTGGNTFHPQVQLLDQAHIPSFTALEHAVHPDTSPAFFQALGLALAHDTHSFALLFREDGETLGAGIGFWDGHSWGIYLVATHPLFRKQGIGTAITRSLIAESQRRKAAPLSLQASPDAQKLYLLHHFREVAPTWAWVPAVC